MLRSMLRVAIFVAMRSAIAPQVAAEGHPCCLRCACAVPRDATAPMNRGDIYPVPEGRATPPCIVVGDRVYTRISFCGSEMAVARSRTFRSGNSQAVRLPKNVAFGDDLELVLVRSGDVLTI